MNKDAHKSTPAKKLKLPKGLPPLPPLPPVPDGHVSWEYMGKGYRCRAPGTIVAYTWDDPEVKDDWTVSDSANGFAQFHYIRAVKRPAKPSAGAKKKAKTKLVYREGPTPTIEEDLGAPKGSWAKHIVKSQAAEAFPKKKTARKGLVFAKRMFGDDHNAFAKVPPGFSLNDKPVFVLPADAASVERMQTQASEAMWNHIREVGANDTHTLACIALAAIGIAATGEGAKS